MHWGSLLIGIVIGMFGVPFAQQTLVKVKGGRA